MKWLSGRGAAAALAVGLATIWGFGWRGFVLLLAFFVSSSLLSQKTNRNERQVIANGGVAALAALAGSWTAFAGALAAATADTWASEIGKHSPTPPRLITTGQPVPAGTDGGITVLGTAGGVVGAGFVAGINVLLPPVLGPGSAHPRWFWAVIAVAGVLGMVLDSLLGATLQGKTRWLDNDAVNLLATLAGAALASVGAAFHA